MVQTNNDHIFLNNHNLMPNSNTYNIVDPFFLMNNNNSKWISNRHIKAASMNQSVRGGRHKIVLSSSSKINNVTFHNNFF